MRLHLSRFFATTFCFAALALAGALTSVAASTTWTADNGNGTFTNPLFYDEFSDPDLIRVGEDYYLAGTTMHSMPGLVVLHSKDLVNWRFLSYALERLDLGPEFNLAEGREAYGQGIWAPCIRYHNGTFYIFSNVNGRGTQVFISKDPAGPWEHRKMDGGIHDLSVLFDDDGRVYAVHGYDEVKLIEMKPDLTGFIEGSERVIIPRGNAMGEGHHFYKINGKYYIISANYAPVGRMQAARADRIDGPYETRVISMRETMGTLRSSSVQNIGLSRTVPEPGFDFKVAVATGNYTGAVPLHQGGIIDLPNGDWWGYSMMDFRSVGRTTFLSPVTWKDGWPYFGLENNLGRSPRTWLKPAVTARVEPHGPYQRSDDFSGAKLLPIWQWNHNPVEGKWSLIEKPGALRLHTLPAEQFLWARNTLTQRVIGPVSSATVKLDTSALKDGDIAGLGLLNIPSAWLGIVKTSEGRVLRFYNQMGHETIDIPYAADQISLRVTGDFDGEKARFSYSLDGQKFVEVGPEILMPYQLKTFQGVRYSLFGYNTEGREGGHVDFDDFRVDEPMADRSANVPLGKVITLTNLGNGTLAWANPHGMLHSVVATHKEAALDGVKFRVHDRGQGRVVLESMSGRGFVTVVGEGLSADVRLMASESPASLFQWQDMLRGQCMLLSLKTNRFLGVDPTTGEPYGADWAGARPDRQDGTVLTWAVQSAE